MMPIVETSLDDYLPGGKYYDPAKDPVEQRLVGAGKGRYRERKKLPCPDDAKALAERDRWEAEGAAALLSFARAMKAKGRKREVETLGLVDPTRCTKRARLMLVESGVKVDDLTRMGPKETFEKATEILNAKSL